MSIDPFWSYSSIEHHFFVGSACSSMRYRRLGSCNHRAIPLRVVCQSNRPMSFQHSWAQQKHLTITFSECVSVWVCVCVCVCVGDGDIRMKNKKERVVAICFVHAWACFKRSAASSRRRLWGTAGPATTRAGGRRSAGRAATPAGTGSDSGSDSGLYSGSDSGSCSDSGSDSGSQSDSGSPSSTFAARYFCLLLELRHRDSTTLSEITGVEAWYPILRVSPSRMRPPDTGNRK